MNRKYIISSFLMAVMAVSVNGCGTRSVQENISLNDNSIISLPDTSEPDETAAPAESAVESAASAETAETPQQKKLKRTADHQKVQILKPVILLPQKAGSPRTIKQKHCLPNGIWNRQQIRAKQKV